MAEDQDRRELAIRAAWLYHDRGLTQQAVSERLGVSRSTVSRILADAERDGIVRVVITEPPPETARMAEEIMARYGLLSVTVGPTFEGESPMEAAAAVMGRRIENIATTSSVTIACGWGRTLSMSASRVRRIPTSGLLIVDAFGHTTTEQMTSSVEVSSTLANRFGAKVMHMPAPAFAQSEAAARTFLESRPVSEAVKRARAADVALVSVGVVGEASLLVTEGFLSMTSMERLMELGAVGEVLGCYYDIDGAPIATPDLHTVGLGYADLESIPRVVGVAGDAAKLDTIRGAMAAGLLKEIAIDDTLARALLA